MNATNRETRVGLDSNCLSYLFDAVADFDEPTDLLAQEKVALIRIWFYTSEEYYITETVLNEISDIRCPERREFHDGFLSVHILETTVQQRFIVSARTLELMQAHPKRNDCQIVAEAEDALLDTFLSYDKNLKRHLGPISKNVQIVTPSSYWIGLNIPKGARPLTAPHKTNPLSIQTWWHW
jgi:hypothetical protein